ncbi:Na+/H+ antiporter subunit A [Rathayibacter toxicus]|uniref:Na+/H+ antiporter subunit A n=1 Tax=Rathayibacter toxicus TaxID=145458 RepID=UPI000CE8BC4A|nr:Na+/H+ antiporter subunit A [Rathayibacter toxicus]PPI53206.1 Na+/H+ antiporter subunit A [Rathayibacter toxicus]QOD10726.1 Na+/H+ antiporter subunit A [Rathayibacter toxicus]QWL31680.1 Na+/H+ antiporter subunit A [Rathayibacter toxicus]QWL33772.1 Na+/H+ antiporter subunit A [Rathayibacter toxicus]QWL35906.1 Na+/H+ antiporter subunit A [Rathayibacter toxicus]
MLLTLVISFTLALVTPWLIERFGSKIFYALALVPAATFITAASALPTMLAGEEIRETVPWIPSLDITLSFRLDALSMVLALIVSGIGALVLAYCANYFRSDEPSLGRFAALLFTFTGVMYGLVTADDVIILFVFWEATSVLSYLLIGHYSGRKESRGAGLQALLVTTLGGVAMLVGIIILIVQANSTSLDGIVQAAPTGPLISVALVLVLVGAFSKSALVPFHFWLPAAMAAPTPVSAYLHAAAMVKAGIYLVARLAPGFADNPVWLPIVVSVGVGTMLVGGWRSLRQYDLKLVLAYGTVSQLGFLTIAVGFGSRDAALAGLALLIAHALVKALLFLVVGIIDHRAGTRDLRKLSGLGRHAPVLAGTALIGVLSMSGIPPLLGFVAKEAFFTSLLAAIEQGSLWAWIALVGITLGSILTVAYSARFLWGAFARKHDVEDTPLRTEPWTFTAPTVLLAAASIVGGIAVSALDPLLALSADALPSVAPDTNPQHTTTAAYHSSYHLALWHGIEPALGLSALVIAIGLLLFSQRTRVARIQSLVPHRIDSAEGYWATVRRLDRVASTVTEVVQRGSLPRYLTVIFAVFVLSAGSAAVCARNWPDKVVLWESPGQLAITAVMILAAVLCAITRNRAAAVLLASAGGYGMVVLFAVQGAPDLALTQALIETVTLVVFVLVLRRLPTRIAHKHQPTQRLLRATIGIAVGAVMALVATIALNARTATPVSIDFPRLAYEEGKGRNIINVLLVDIRAWDTMGEISVLVVVATGVASLIFLSSRAGRAPRLPQQGEARRGYSLTRNVTAAVQNDVRDRGSWLVAGRTLHPGNRSIVLEVLVRLLFHPAMIVSVYLLFTGHNTPGGGFAGGLLAGLALVARYLAGGRFELGEAAPIDAGKVLGVGLLFAVGTALSSLMLGLQVLQASWLDGELPLLGELHLGTPTFFDIGVYLIVIGLTLDILRSLGGEVDRHGEEAEDGADGGDGIAREVQNTSRYGAAEDLATNLSTGSAIVAEPEKGGDR